MNIAVINNFNIKNCFGIKPQQKALYPNLAPLAKDTVSFSGRSELIAESMSDAPSVTLCKTAAENSAGACYYLYSVLDKYLSDFADFKENQTSKDILKVKPKTNREKSKNHKIATYEVRIKSHSSIREKVISRYTKMYNKEHNQFANELYEKLISNIPLTETATKKNVLDVIKEYPTPPSSSPKNSAYGNAQYLITEVIDLLDSGNYFNYNGVTADEKKQIIENIIAEMSEYTSPLINSEGKTIDPKTMSGIKYYANDIVGARIVMKESSPEYTDKILCALKQAVADGVLKITSIENNVPSAEKIPEGHKLSDYAYASDSQLRSLKTASGAPVLTNESKTGYMAIHINVDLSDPIFKNYGGVYNDYSGEIQIIGRDVEQLKEVEDLCYKLKDKKNAINIAYKPFKEHFLKYYNEETMQAFDDYTYDLYLAQRVMKQKKRASMFPTIKQLGYDGKVSPYLDFNQLKRIWSFCKAQYEISEAESEKKTLTEKEIISAGNVRTIKKLVDNKFNKL